jgi:uncharacterized membrane protein YeaQ/YmgE (transglycosylase-associated protein family)
MDYVWMAVVGFFVGLVARAIVPGQQQLGWILTACLGIGGASVANLLGQALGFYRAGQVAGFLASVLGAVLVLVVYGMLTQKGNGNGNGSA